MLKLEKFTDEDLHQIKQLPKASRAVVLFVFAICFPLSFLFGLTGLFKKGYGYWTTTLAFLTLFSIVLLYSLLKDYLKYKRDLSRQVKYSGAIIVTGKSTKKDETLIFTDSNDLEKLSIYPIASFSEIKVGDLLFIEVAKYSKTILRSCLS